MSRASTGSPTIAMSPAPPRRPAALGPLIRLTVRGLLGRRRTLGVVALAAAPVLVAAILAFAGGLGDADTMALDVFATITLGLVIPIAGLILGTAAIGTEIDEGSVVYLLLKPVPRRTVMLAKMLVAAAATTAITAPAALISGFLLLGGTAPGLLVATVAATLLAAILYAVVFVALSVFTGRALVVGLGYVLVWEGFVTSLLPGTRILSIREYALAVADAISPGGGAASGEGVDTLVAVVLSAVVLVAAFALGSWRLGRFEATDTG
jgi:ABC-2 type transport system permease protein